MKTTTSAQTAHAVWLHLWNPAHQSLDIRFNLRSDTVLHSQVQRGPMPLLFSVCPFGRLVICKVEGIPTPEEARAFLRDVLAQRNFRRGFAFLGQTTDSDIPHAAFTTHLAREVEAQARNLAPCKWAVMVPSETGRALVKKRAALTDRTGVQVAPFLTVDEATNWLGSISEYPADRADAERRGYPPSSRLTPLGSQ